MMASNADFSPGGGGSLGPPQQWSNASCKTRVPFDHPSAFVASSNPMSSIKGKLYSEWAPYDYERQLRPTSGVTAGAVQRTT